MAILTGGLLGRSRNRIGSLVTYVRDAQQVARSLAANVSNPRTTSQMAQRVRLANLVSFYKANAAWMQRYAFTRRKSTWSVYNAFVSANIGAVNVYLTKAEAAAGCAIVAPYKVTDGSIPSIVHYPYTGTTGLTDIYLGASFVFASDTTVGELSSAILASNNAISAGWQLSLIINYQQSTGSTYYILPRYYEITLAVGDTTPLSDRMPLDHLAAVANETGTNKQLAYAGGQGDPEVGYTFVLSNKVNGVVNVSSQYMQLTDTGIYNSFGESTKLTAAADSYGSSTDAFLAPGYGSGGASNSDVTLPSSILSVALNSTTAHVGTYLGAYGSESAGTSTLTFNQDVAEDSITKVEYYWAASGGGSTAYTSGFAYNGAAVVVTIPEGNTPNPSGAITAVVVTFTSGAVLRATFLESAPEVTD